MSDVTNVNQHTDILEQSKYATDEDRDDLGGGVRSSFPVISYRGSKWRLRYQGNEALMVDDRGIPVPEIAVCLLRVPDHLSKRYYAGGYPGEGQDRKPPDCWSNDGIRPDPTLTPPQQPDGRPLPATCARCYFDGIGSSVVKSPDGRVIKKTKACGDYKRVAVKLYYPQMLDEEMANSPILLTVPAASLQNLKAYGKDLVRRKAHALARVTYIKLDPDVSYGKQEFRPGPALADEEFLNVKALRNSEEVAGILREEMMEAAEPIAEPGEVQTENVQQAPVVRDVIDTRAAPPAEQAPQATARAAQPAPTRSPIPAPTAPPLPTGAPLQGIPQQRPLPTAAPIPAGRAVGQGSINSALRQPAAPPPSARVVQHPSSVQTPPVQQEPEPQYEDGANAGDVGDGDPIQKAMNDKFAQIMGGKIQSE